LSSIVKAKWVSQMTISEVVPIVNQPEAEVDEEGQFIRNEEMVENQIDHNESVEAMHAANELMKEAIRASQEIKEKSQETGYKEGFSNNKWVNTLEEVSIKYYNTDELYNMNYLLS